MPLSDDDRNRLPRLLEDVSKSVEELLLTGLTTASQATRQTLDVSFREASRMRLLRLGSTLRASNEELGRFVHKSPHFSPKRLTFFLNRAWMLCRGLAIAIENDDQDEFDRLLWTPASQPVDKLEVVTVGVSKKEVQGAYCAFEFRLRTTKEVDEALPKGHRLVWSCIFPLKPGTEVPAEGFLHLPQKQKFKANDFLENRTLMIQNCAISLDSHGGGRVSLAEKSTVETTSDFSDWTSIMDWDRDAAINRIRGHETTPFDLEIEMQEEVVLNDWSIDKPEMERDGQVTYPLVADHLQFDAVAATSNEGKALRKKLEAYRTTKQRPMIYGLVHYEMCRLVFQPLTTFEESGPVHMMISEDKIDRAALLKTLNFN